MKIKIRSVGRDQFWSAGRKWNKDGTIVEIIPTVATPRKFLRAKFDERAQCYCLDESKIADGEPIPQISIRGTRAYWKGDKMVVRVDESKRRKIKDGGAEREVVETIPVEYDVLTELDFPTVDGDYQKWCNELRRQHIEADQLTESDLQCISADNRFLAIESAEPIQLPSKAKK
jgi:hypothetical protein